MDAPVNAEKVAGACRAIADVCKDKGFSTVDIIVALSEMTGRFIVFAAQGNKGIANQLTPQAVDHIRKTVAIGTKQSQSIWTPD